MALVIAFTGCRGSGKKELADHIAELQNRRKGISYRLRSSDYQYTEKRKSNDFAAVDYDQMALDFAKALIKCGRISTLRPKPLILIEDEYLLNNLQILSQAHIVFFLTAPPATLAKSANRNGPLGQFERVFWPTYSQTVLPELEKKRTPRHGHMYFVSRLYDSASRTAVESITNHYLEELPRGEESSLYTCVGDPPKSLCSLNAITSRDAAIQHLKTCPPESPASVNRKRPSPSRLPSNRPLKKRSLTPKRIAAGAV